MLKAIIATAVKMAHIIWTLPINKDVCTVLATVEHSLVNRPRDLLHQLLQVILSMKQVSIFSLCDSQTVIRYSIFCYRF